MLRLALLVFCGYFYFSSSYLFGESIPKGFAPPLSERYCFFRSPPEEQISFKIRRDEIEAMLGQARDLLASIHVQSTSAEKVIRCLQTHLGSVFPDGTVESTQAQALDLLTRVESFANELAVMRAVFSFLDLATPTSVGPDATLFSGFSQKNRNLIANAVLDLPMWKGPSTSAVDYEQTLSIARYLRSQLARTDFFEEVDRQGFKAHLLALYLILESFPLQSASGGCAKGCCGQLLAMIDALVPKSNYRKTLDIVRQLLKDPRNVLER